MYHPVLMNAVNWGTKLRHGVGASWNRPHEVNSKVPQLQPQLQPQLPNPEIANLKLRLKLPELRRELRPSWRSLKHPNNFAAYYSNQKFQGRF